VANDVLADGRDVGRVTSQGIRDHGNEPFRRHLIGNSPQPRRQFLIRRSNDHDGGTIAPVRVGHGGEDVPDRVGTRTHSP
jgi:hypothetical protein